MVDSTKKIRTAIYPYDIEMYSYIKYQTMLAGIDIKILLSPQGWALENQKVSQYEVKSCLTEKDYFSIDAIWITDSLNQLQNSQLFNVIDDMLRHGKQIILSRKLEEDTKQVILKLCKKYSEILIDYTNRKEEMLFDNLPMTLQKIYTPIVCVAGVGERIGKFDVQMEIKEHFEKMGYYTILVSSRTNSIFLNNVYPFPAFMDSQLATENKIIAYNQYIKTIEQNEKPEVIVVGVPDGIMPISKFQVGHFGVHAFEVFNAINPDFMVMNLYCNNISKIYLNELQQLVKYRFHANIDCFCLNNTMQDVFTVNREMPIEYFSKNTEDVEQLAKQLVKSADGNYGIYTQEQLGILTQFIIERLNEYDSNQVL